MSEHAEHDAGYNVERYFDLVARGLLDEEDRVELLEGLVAFPDLTVRVAELLPGY